MYVSGYFTLQQRRKCTYHTILCALWKNFQ